ncbi:type III-A CRISPR-associated RAMP protein Csm5 [Venenivibrio stagnispumantis]|uniref:CRISPR system Cms protein Csm5 n=1 Tax=Venenivibrio stagnispumantis TaxID=407998 RepID=A0AA45WJT6_9AQUI|nr:type III-A CRISPR-associated RAMP protein Csm5 [Venenivibrio stagnispumantis]MCW4572907.1 type III-A CRISPR-associated RAMP protein Csm5 [Venenivibrio stagnispumantis]SMP04237.1 CRISPR type III-A/MTUBE-associated RAMP protein Csm5 [Venenivibrio stagnispumantis]
MGYIEEKINLTIKSPVHIGSGEKITKLEYIPEGRNIVIYSLNKFLSKLDEKQLENIIAQIESNNEIDENLIRKYLNDIKRYSLNVNDTNINEIHEFIKTADKPYIPGSEIKGAIRTAILYSIVKNNLQEFKDKLKFVNEDKNNKIAREIEEKAFGKISNDIMKFFMVEDTKPIETQNLVAKKIEIINTRKKFSEYAECLKKDTKLETKIKIFQNRREFQNFKYNKYIINWKQSCYEYAKDLIDVEKEYWKDKNQEILKFYQNLENENTEENPLIRIGRFTGKLSHTIVLLSKKTGYNISFPKTRRLTKENEVLGWIKS